MSFNSPTNFEAPDDAFSLCQAFQQIDALQTSPEATCKDLLMGSENYEAIGQNLISAAPEALIEECTDPNDVEELGAEVEEEVLVRGEQDMQEDQSKKEIEHFMDLERSIY